MHSVLLALGLKAVWALVATSFVVPVTSGPRWIVGNVSTKFSELVPFGILLSWHHLMPVISAVAEL